MNSILQKALTLAAKGKLVFPCRPNGKQPLTVRGFKDATTNPDLIRQWWTDYPQANLAMASGAESGIVVIDVDVDQEKGKNGESALAELLAKHGPLPHTLVARTPRGGRHLYFKYPGPGIRVPCSTDKLGNGVDVRAAGGYVLVPPSRTDRGEYRWESMDPPAELPEWLLGLVAGLFPNGTVQAPRKQVDPRGNNEAHRIRDALAHISPDLPHDGWVRILMSLHGWDSNRGKDLAREWSANCPEKYRERDFEAAWRSFKPGGGVTLGTLFEMAGRHGWTPPTWAPRNRQEPARVQEEDLPDLVIAGWPAPPRPEAFYGPIGEWVRRLEPHTESDAMALLIQALVGFGNLIGRHVHFQVEADKHYCNLNAVTVGNSSKARKGTAFGHVHKLLRELDLCLPRFITGLSTGEGLIHCVRDPVIRTGKDGQEELVDDGVRDKRLLAVESEFGRTLQCSNREGNTLSAVVRQAFDTGDLRVAVKGSPQVATGAHISIIGHVTLVELNLLLTKSDSANGFANRFLWAAVKRSKLLPEGGRASSVDLSDLVQRLKRAVEFAKEPWCLSKDEPATELWRDIYRQLSQERPGLLGSVVSRAEALVMRLAMLLAVTDCSDRIRVPHLQGALAIWDYCEASAAFVFGDSLGNPVAERVLKLLETAGEPGLGLAAIYEGLSGHIEKEELHAALKQLHSQGLAEYRKVPTSGRPSQVWFATKAACERSEESAKKVAEAERLACPPPEDPSSLNSLNSPHKEFDEIL